MSFISQRSKINKASGNHGPITVGINPVLSDLNTRRTSKMGWRYFEANRNSAMFSTQRPPDDWPDALDHLAIVWVANDYTKLGKNKWKFVT